MAKVTFGLESFFITMVQFFFATGMLIFPILFLLFSSTGNNVVKKYLSLSDLSSEQNKIDSEKNLPNYDCSKNGNAIIV